MLEQCLEPVSTECATVCHPAPQMVFGEGDDYSWGRMVGEAEVERIVAAQDVLSELPVFRMHQPWWLPYQFYLYYSEWVARQTLESPVLTAYPNLSERLRGMADGAGVRLETLFLFHMLEAACNQHSDREVVATPPPGGCTAFVLGSHRVQEREPVILHNLDQVPQAKQFLTVRRNAIKGELSTIGLTLSPLCGVVNGMNEAGLCISYNYAAAVEVDQKGTPVSLSISDALSHCRTVPEAIDRITSRTRNHGAMLMLADETGCSARLELSGTYFHVEMLDDPAGILFHSNSYRSEEMEPRQVAPTAIYGETCPEPLRGIRILESSEYRDKRLLEVLQECGSFSLDNVFSLLIDHGEDPTGNANTVCMHGPYWSTVASVRMLPKSRVFSVSYGSACSGEFHDFTF